MVGYVLPHPKSNYNNVLYSLEISVCVEPEVEKEPEQGYHDHFVQAPEQSVPISQAGVKKLTHVPASHRSADLYEFLPERCVILLRVVITIIDNLFAQSQSC